MRVLASILGITASCALIGCAGVGPTSEGVERVGSERGPFVGTAFRVGPNLYATAAHVPRKGDHSLTIGGLPATVIVEDEEADVAVVLVPDAPPGKFFEFARPVLGELATSRGFTGPDPSGDPCFTRGCVSFLNNMGWAGYSGGVQPGMSGSPVFDEHGKVIGIICGAIPWRVGEVMVPNAIMGNMAQSRIAERLVREAVEVEKQGK